MDNSDNTHSLYGEQVSGCYGSIQVFEMKRLRQIVGHHDRPIFLSNSRLNY